MVKFESPRIRGPFDPHDETPLTGEELDIADNHVKAVEIRAREAAERVIRAEPETDEERTHRLEQLRKLSRRYGSNGKL